MFIGWEVGFSVGMVLDKRWGWLWEKLGLVLDECWHNFVSHLF